MAGSTEDMHRSLAGKHSASSSLTRSDETATLTPMPAPALNVDWEAIKAHAIQHGPRAAARAFMVNSNTVLARSADEGWLKQAGKAVIAQPLPSSMQPKAIKTIVTASEAAKTQMESYGSRTRIAAAKTVLKGMETASRLDGEAIIASAPALASLGKLAVTARLPEWQDESGHATVLGIAVTVSSPSQVVDVEATVLDARETGQSQ